MNAWNAKDNNNHLLHTIPSKCFVGHMPGRMESCLHQSLRMPESRCRFFSSFDTQFLSMTLQLGHLRNVLVLIIYLMEVDRQISLPAPITMSFLSQGLNVADIQFAVLHIFHRTCSTLCCFFLEWGSNNGKPIVNIWKDSAWGHFFCASIEKKSSVTEVIERTAYVLPQGLLYIFGVYGYHPNTVSQSTNLVVGPLFRSFAFSTEVIRHTNAQMQIWRMSPFSSAHSVLKGFASIQVKTQISPGILMLTPTVIHQITRK